MKLSVVLHFSMPAAWTDGRVREAVDRQLNTVGALILRGALRGILLDHVSGCIGSWSMEKIDAGPT